MKWLESRVLWGSLLILGGVLFLLQNLGFLVLGNFFWVIVLGLGGLLFLGVFIENQANWWALIPGGVLFTLAATVGLEQFFPGLETVGIFFLGMSLTFGLVAALPNPQGEMRWAWIPAGVLLLMGLIFMATAGELLKYLWPAALILGGFFLLLRSFRGGRR